MAKIFAFSLHGDYWESTDAKDQPVDRKTVFSFKVSPASAENQKLILVPLLIRSMLSPGFFHTCKRK
ncbi:hypothetical protein TSAR_006127 [Trichomalopsis sarcophagae]|uniref:Uncharacterized protein n=1 Tax=Trichomalopsis sarcophagae TaxID=543379 RepID=A0A232F8V7_9HYME|nr:hypothetical protein TSAR_006127 [Trichomalopsis sarcophagae]